MADTSERAAMTSRKKFNKHTFELIRGQKSRAQQFLYFRSKRQALLDLGGARHGTILTVWHGASKTNHINLLRDIPTSWGERGLQRWCNPAERRLPAQAIARSLE